MGGTTPPCGRIWVGVSKVTSNVLKLHSQKLHDPDKVIEHLQKKYWAISKRHNTAGYDASPSLRKMENKPKQ